MMSNKIEVGKTYRLVDASKDPMLAEALDKGWITLPVDGIVTIHSIEASQATGEAMGCSHTKGMAAEPWAMADVAGDYLAVQQSGVDNGAFEEVTTKELS